MTKADLIEQKSTLTTYLLSKVRAGDWHAVQDSASDIREIVAKLDLLAELDAPQTSGTMSEAAAELANPLRARRLG